MPATYSFFILEKKIPPQGRDFLTDSILITTERTYQVQQVDKQIVDV